MCELGKNWMKLFAENAISKLDSRRFYSILTRSHSLSAALAPSLRHLIFYKIFHSISASGANFIFPLFGNINYEIIHLCCNLHTIPNSAHSSPSPLCTLPFICARIVTLFQLPLFDYCFDSVAHKHSHIWQSQENGKLSTIRFYSFGLSCAFISLTSCVQAIWRPTQTWCECQWLKSCRHRRCHQR